MVDRELSKENEALSVDRNEENIKVLRINKEWSYDMWKFTSVGKTFRLGEIMKALTTQEKISVIKELIFDFKTNTDKESEEALDEIVRFVNSPEEWA